MILYVNGDSHAAGAEINNSYCFADDAHKRWADRLYNWLTQHQLL